jgi:hypothetical protein
MATYSLHDGVAEYAGHRVVAVDGQALVDKVDHGLDEVVVEVVKVLRHPILEHVAHPQLDSLHLGVRVGRGRYVVSVAQGRAGQGSDG